MFARSVRQILATRLRGAGRIVQSRQFAAAPSVVASSDEFHGLNMAVAAAAALISATVTMSTTHCEENTPSTVAKEDLDEVTAMHSMDTLPVYDSEFVAHHNGEDGTRIWMTYGGVVYDVTDFIPNHPGGSEQIMKASGGVSDVCTHVARNRWRAV
jgi:cytochrome b involved in lipid metabolism